ncbi:MAG: hypothetical protein ACWA5R_08025 [bacterium]
MNKVCQSCAMPFKGDPKNLVPMQMEVKALIIVATVISKVVLRSLNLPQRICRISVSKK